MNQFLPEPVPTAIFWVNNNILLTGLWLYMIMTLLPSFFECASVFVNVSIHVFLLHLVLVIQKGNKEVGFLPHVGDVVS